MASNSQNVGLHYEGVLEKAGKRFFEGFRKRWFTLNGKDLFYYKSPEKKPENLLGIIDLTKVKAVNPFKMINNNAFQIITSTRTYTFTASSSQLMTEWISVLRQAMQLQSFMNKKSQKRIGTASSQDDAGYEVVSRSSRTSSEISDQSNSDDNLYDQVTASPSKNGSPKSYPISTYETVGSFKRSSSGEQNQGEGSYGVITAPELNIEPHENVSPTSVKSSSEDNPSQGSYGVIGNSPAKIPDTSSLYSTVQKPKPKAQETVGDMYAEVQSVDTKPSPKINVKPMPIICESDDDDDDDEEEENGDDTALVEENLEEVQDPLPSPKESLYAVDQIRLFLKDFKIDENAESRKENLVKDEETTEDTVIPETCVMAFAKLKEFLDELEDD